MHKELQELQHDNTTTMYTFKTSTSPHKINISTTNSQSASPNMWVTVLQR